MHSSTYEYLKPTDQQIQAMAVLREAARRYGEILDAILPPGNDKKHVIRQHRATAMWANVAITRFDDGCPREDDEKVTESDNDTALSAATGVAPPLETSYVRRDAISLAIDLIGKQESDKSSDKVMPVAKKFAEFILNG